MTSFSAPIVVECEEVQEDAMLLEVLWWFDCT